MKQLYLLFLLLVCSFPLAGQDAVKIACIGNSVTYGYGHENPSETSYPVQLAAMLGDGYDVRNFGYSGATLLSKGHRPYIRQDVYRQALEFAPDIAVIHLGLNDTDPRNWPNYRDEFVPDYLALIDTLRAQNPDVRVWICRMTPIFHWHPRFKSGTRDWFWQIQTAIERVAELADVGLIDLHTPLYAHPDLFADALHPNPEGAQIIANTVYSALTGNYGGLSLSAIYTDGMVIQRDKPFLLQGRADVGSKVTARLGKQKRKTVVGADGRWSLLFDAPAIGRTYELDIECGDDKITINDIVVGEVWLCSGQSNMEWMLKQSKDAERYIAEAAKKNIRIYDMKARVHTDNVEWSPYDLEQLNRHNYSVPATWQQINEQNAADFSAVAYHFGAMLADSLGLPVGLICNAVGGAPAESFIDRKTLEHNPQLVDILYNWRGNDMIQEWCRGRAMQNIKNSANPLQRHPYEPCYLYESMIAPLVGFPIKGAIWYQGESNAHNVELHEVIFPVMINSWRSAWADDFPFYFVQLSSINRPSWPHFRDSQRRMAMSIANCGMAVSSDKGDFYDVHPRDKQPVGERLARQALNKTYGLSNVVPSGPSIRRAENKGNEIILYFDYADALHSSDGRSLRTFEIADESGLYCPADEVIVENGTIRLSAKQIKKPVSARYAWQPFTDANLVNGEGLPASTFEISINE